MSHDVIAVPVPNLATVPGAVHGRTLALGQYLIMMASDPFAACPVIIFRVLSGPNGPGESLQFLDVVWTWEEGVAALAALASTEAVAG